MSCQAEDEAAVIERKYMSPHDGKMMMNEMMDEKIEFFSQTEPSRSRSLVLVYPYLEQR